MKNQKPITLPARLAPRVATKYCSFQIAAAVKKEKPQNEYFLKKQQQSEERKRRTRLKKAEEEIERLDGAIAEVQQALASDEVISDYEKLLELTNRLEALQAEQEQWYEIWEELSD